MNKIRKAAEYLMYKGPTLKEKILEASQSNLTYKVIKTNDKLVLDVHSETSYDLKIIDRFWFNSDEELYKQTLVMRNTEKVIFNKFQDAQNLLESINSLNDFSISS